MPYPHPPSSIPSHLSPPSLSHPPLLPPSHPPFSSSTPTPSTSITVENGGFVVSNGLTVRMYRGMGLQDGLTAYDSGMVVTGGGTVFNSGLFVTAPGYLTVQSRGKGELKIA